MDTQAEFPFVSGQLTRLLTDIGVAAKIVNHQVNRAGLAGILGDAGSENTHNEAQQKLDVFADRTFMRILTAGKSVAGIGSEEQEDYILCGDQGKSGKYVVMIDPLDGSSNADVNVSIGTIFSIFRRVTPMGESLSDQDFLQRGTEQVVAGYILYGSSTMLVYTTGSGVNGFTLDPAVGEFFLSHAKMQFLKLEASIQSMMRCSARRIKRQRALSPVAVKHPKWGSKAAISEVWCQTFTAISSKAVSISTPVLRAILTANYGSVTSVLRWHFWRWKQVVRQKMTSGQSSPNSQPHCTSARHFTWAASHLIQGLRSCWMENP